MKVNCLGNNIYKSKLLKKGLEFAADNGALFAAGASLALSTVARPLAIYLTPKTDKENRKLACAKSIASSIVGFGIMLGASVPIAKGIKSINKAPEKYLNKETITALKDSTQPLTSSKPYQFATQLFKLGIGTLTAIPKSIITCALIPPVMSLFNRKPKVENNSGENTSSHKNKPPQNNGLTFTGRNFIEPLAKKMGKFIDKKPVREFAVKHKDSNYPMHIASLTDAAATGAFIAQTKKSKSIPDERKNILCNNAAISTGLSIGCGYGVDKLLNKPTNKFIENFKKANQSSPKLDKYIEGIKIAKPTLILGTLYYCAIPFVSTFLAERTKSGKNK